MTPLKAIKMPFIRKTLLATCTLVLASFSHAEDNTATGQVYQGIIHSYYSVNGFYNFSANQADKQQNELIQESIDTIDSLMENLDETASGASEQLGEASNAWSTYRKVLKQNVNEVVATGYPDLRLAGDMANTNIAFNGAMQALYKALSAQQQADERTQTSRDAATTLALMMTKYSARSTSTVSQVYSGGDAEITIDALAAQFENKMKKLTELSKGNAEAAKLLDSANTKWDFIKSSYINYNENRVNFIVNLYSKKIISDLEEALAI